MPERYDVVLFGPTGVTGREVARHLARRAPELGLRWAAAGRDRGRVESALASVGAVPDGVLEADTTRPPTIDGLAGSATVVANLVGPYARYGEVVYESCARHGTAQLDLTGEIDWLAGMVDRYQGAAEATGARIVPTAGFEALPFDLAALLAARTAHERTGQPVADVDVAVTVTATARVRRAADAVSGGTFVSGVEALRRGTGGASTNPYVLDPPGSSASGAYELRPRRHAGTGAWLGPTVPSPFINPPIVHRGAALLRAAGDGTFAEGFRYREGSAVPGGAGPLAPAAAAAFAGLTAGLQSVARVPPRARGALVDALLRVGPKAGDGPAAEDLDRWAYRLDARATTTGGRTCDVVVEATGHPGYKSTATLVGEAALALADPSADVPQAAGFLTPATALGTGVLDRFGEAGATFSVVG